MANVAAPKGKIEIDLERCKGCTLCLTACKKGVLAQSEKRNVKGYVPVEAKDEERCSGCGLCALICPDMAIRVYRACRDKAGGVGSK